MSPLNITQPLSIWSIMATIRWCPIYPKWDIYQPLLIDAFCSRIRRRCRRLAEEALLQTQSQHPLLWDLATDWCGLSRRVPKWDINPPKKKVIAGILIVVFMWFKLCHLNYVIDCERDIRWHYVIGFAVLKQPDFAMLCKPAQSERPWVIQTDWKW